MPIPGIVAGSLVQSNSLTICQAMGIPVSVQYRTAGYGPYDVDPQGRREPQYLVLHASAGSGSINDIVYARNNKSYNFEFIRNSATLYIITDGDRSGHSVDARVNVHNAYKAGTAHPQWWLMIRPAGALYNPSNRQSEGTSVAHNNAGNSSQVLTDACILSMAKWVAARLVIMGWGLNKVGNHYNMKDGKSDINDLRSPLWKSSEIWFAIQEQIPVARVALGFEGQEIDLLPDEREWLHSLFMIFGGGNRKVYEGDQNTKAHDGLSRVLEIGQRVGSDRNGVAMAPFNQTITQVVDAATADILATTQQARTFAQSADTVGKTNAAKLDQIIALINDLEPGPGGDCPTKEQIVDYLFSRLTLVQKTGV